MASVVGHMAKLKVKGGTYRGGIGVPRKGKLATAPLTWGHWTRCLAFPICKMG